MAESIPVAIWVQHWAMCYPYAMCIELCANKCYILNYVVVLQHSQDDIKRYDSELDCNIRSDRNMTRSDCSFYVNRDQRFHRKSPDILASCQCWLQLEYRPWPPLDKIDMANGHKDKIETKSFSWSARSGAFRLEWQILILSIFDRRWLSMTGWEAGDVLKRDKRLIWFYEQSKSKVWTI